MPELKRFRFWCNVVLPLVYDDSLSYYEVLCKVVDYINKLIEQDKIFSEEIEQLKIELAEVQKWINDFDPKYLEKLIAKYIATMIFVEINDDGYIVYNIPWAWQNITFNTTGIDINVPTYEYGRLVLSY